MTEPNLRRDPIPTTEKIFMMKALPDDVANEVMDRTGGMRLNSVMKAQVVEKALSHAFDKRRAALLDEEHKIAKACFVHAFGVRAISLLKRVGEPFVYANTNTYGEPNENGTPIRWWIGGQHIQMRVKGIPVPLGFGRHACDHGKKNPFSITMEKNAELVERARKWQDDCVAIDKESEKVKTTLTTLLQGISTYKSLEKNWPEGKPFYKHLPKAFPYRHQVPATLVDELNRSLDIG